MGLLRKTVSGRKFTLAVVIVLALSLEIGCVKAEGSWVWGKIFPPEP